MKPHERKNWIVDEFRGNAFEKAVLQVLDRHANKNDESWPSVPTIARGAGIGTTSARKVLARLIESGVVSLRIRKGKSKIYRLHCDEDAKTPTRTCTTPQHVRGDEQNKEQNTTTRRKYTKTLKNEIRSYMTVLDGGKAG